VVSSADDNKVLVLDPASRKVINQIKINAKNIKGTSKASTLSPFAESKQSRAVAINPVNGNLAIATNHG
jgi:WD40 repeat protein